jgi:2-dehydropantoate 2-reductase
MRILIVGAGATGGYFGARLVQAGRDVTFLVREHRAAQLRNTGLQVTGTLGDFKVQPKLILASEITAPFDLVILTVKSYQLDAAMADIAPAVGTDTVILPLLNGLAHLDTLIARFSDRRILGGSVRIHTDLDADGRIHIMDTLHELNFGERDKSVTPRIEALAKEFAGAGFNDKLSPDILAFMWQKWTMLASLGAITCLMRGTIGQVASIPGGTETATAIYNEALAISAANGYPIAPAVIENLRTYLTNKQSSFTSSMQRDMLKGAPVEADHILGDFLTRAAAHNVDAPLFRAAYALLSVYSNTLKK